MSTTKENLEIAFGGESQAYQKYSAFAKKAEKDGWEVKFFCRYEDKVHYKRDLDLSDNMQICLSLNEDGLKAMENQISYSIEEMVKSKKR